MKTHLAVTIIKKFLDHKKTIPDGADYPVIVTVPTNPLKEAWEKDLISRGIDLKDVWVTTIQKVALHSSEVTNCGLLVIDECHRCLSKEFLKVFKFITFKYFLGLTATINRNDSRDLILTSKFPIVDNISIQECLENNWISPCKIYKVYLEPEDIDVYNFHDERFKNFFSFFNHDFNLAMSMIGKDGHIHRARYTNYKFPNAKLPKDKQEARKIVDANAFGFQNEMKLRKQYIFENPLKLRVAEKIIEARSGKKIITFSKTIKMADNIKPNVDNCYYLHSGKTKKKNKITLEEFNELSSGVINSGKMLEEGITVSHLNVGIMVSYDSSKIAMIQKLGRVLRYEEGKEAEMFILVIKGTAEEFWANKALTGLSYETIYEDQLDNLLSGEDYINVIEKKPTFTFGV